MTAAPLTAAQRQAIPRFTVIARADGFWIDGQAAHMTRSYRVECAKCEQLIGLHCACTIGFVVFIPALHCRRAICLDCMTLATEEK